MLEVNPALNKIQISLIRQIAMESAKYIDRPSSEPTLINLTIGEPDLPQPKGLLKETAEFVITGNLGYPKTGGVQILKEELALWCNEKYGNTLSDENILVTVGSTEGLSTTIKTIIQPGDEVILPLPAYAGYEPLLIMAGAKVIKVDTTPFEYQLPVSELKKYVTDKTRAILLNYPTNPTGAMISSDNRDEILEFAHTHKLYIISDEVYSEIVFNGRHNSFLEFKDDKYLNNVIVINGFSKSHSLTGWRIGWVTASKELIKNLTKVQQYSVTSPSVISQQGAYIALKSYRDVSDRALIYKERVDKVFEAFDKRGIKGIKPKGGIYAFMDLREHGITDSFDFSMSLLREARVSTVPGIAFGVEGFIRLSLVKDIDTLLRAVERIANFINVYK